MLPVQPVRVAASRLNPSSLPAALLLYINEYHQVMSLFHLNNDLALYLLSPFH